MGFTWVVLTVAFEVGLGTLLGLTSERILADYDLAQGGFMVIRAIVYAAGAGVGCSRTPLTNSKTRRQLGDSMRFHTWSLVGLATLAAVAPPASAAPTVYPTGVTIYDPARTWNGYTVLSPLATQAVIVIDMNGNVVKRWDDFNNSAGGPARVLPGGGVIAASGARPPHQESLELVQRDFDGNVVWSFNRNEQIELRDRGTVWSSRQHHDWQREDFPAGYYSPDARPPSPAATR